MTQIRNMAENPALSATPKINGTNDMHETSVRLEGLRIVELRREWTLLFRSCAPTGRSSEVLRRAIAWRLQERAHGGLSAWARRRLSQLNESAGREPKTERRARLRPGTLLMREWAGTRHEVRILEAGCEYLGKSYRSLSEIATTITGTRWNGPRFFGLRSGDNGLD